MINHTLLKKLCFLTLCFRFIFADVSVSVETNDHNKNPQIHVNGQAVRPRMFWGGFRGGDAEIDQEWQNVEFELSAPFNANATLHFRFGNYPGEVWLKDLKIKNNSNGHLVFPNNTFTSQSLFNSSWNVYPPDERNTVGTIDFPGNTFHLTLVDPPAGESWPGFHIYSDYFNMDSGTVYQVTCKAKASGDRDLRPAVYHVGNGWTYLGGPDTTFEEQIRMAKDVGVDFITFNVHNCWFSPEAGDDWKPIDIACQKILSINPNALLIPRISMEPPHWWFQENPDAYMIYEDDGRGDKVCISHRGYRADAAAYLERACRHLAETFPNNFAGIHPSGQNTGEWFYEKSWGTKLSSYDVATLAAWQEYAESAVSVPDADSRRPANDRLLLDPEEDELVILFNKFLQKEMADFLIELSDAAKRGMGKDKLFLIFYGYHYELAAPWNSPASTGHYALESLLNAPNIDIITGPISYHDRGPGGCGANMSSVESILRAGKLWLNEDDTRTYLSTNLEDHNRYGGCSTQEETKAVLLRNMAQSALRGYGSWWMDHGAGTEGGWFSDTELWKVIPESESLDRYMLDRDDHYRPDIAMILSENSMLHISGGSTLLGRSFIYESRKIMSTAGCSFGQFLLDPDYYSDIKSPLKLFLTPWALSNEERSAILSNRHKNEVRVWFYAPGYIHNNENSISSMNDLTGFDFHKTTSGTTMASPSERGETYGLISSWGFNDEINPLFTVAKDSCIILAKYANGRTAVAIKESDKGKDVFVGVPKITRELLFALINIANIQSTSDDQVHLWNAGNYSLLHGMENSLIDLEFDKVNTLYIQDAMNGDILTSGHSISLDIEKGETRIIKNMSIQTSTDNMITESDFILKQNYPNPFNPITSISVQLSANSDLDLSIYDVQGRKVHSLYSGTKEAGNYTFDWNAKNLASGVYICSMKVDGIVWGTKKMVLMK